LRTLLPARGATRQSHCERTGGGRRGEEKPRFGLASRAEQQRAAAVMALDAYSCRCEAVAEMRRLCAKKATSCVLAWTRDSTDKAASAAELSRAKAWSHKTIRWTHVNGMASRLRPWSQRTQVTSKAPRAMPAINRARTESARLLWLTCQINGRSRQTRICLCTSRRHPAMRALSSCHRASVPPNGLHNHEPFLLHSGAIYLSARWRLGCRKPRRQGR